MNASVSAAVAGGDVDDSSPYEPVAANRQPDTFRLASISSGTAALGGGGAALGVNWRLRTTIGGIFLSSIPAVDHLPPGIFGCVIEALPTPPLTPPRLRGDLPPSSSHQ